MVPLSVGPDGTLTDSTGQVVGLLVDKQVVPAAGVSLPDLFRGPAAATPLGLGLGTPRDELPGAAMTATPPVIPPVTSGSPQPALPVQESFPANPDAGKPTVLPGPALDQPPLVPNSTASPQPSVNLGDVQEGFTALGPQGPTILEARSNGTPTPAQQSEDHVGASLGDGHKAQPSYLNGKEVKYGTPGSSRPDFALPDGSVTWEVKNYNLATNSASLVDNIAKQAIARAANLPAGATQNVAIDRTGQVTTPAQRDATEAAIEQKSGGIIKQSQVEFFERN